MNRAKILQYSKRKEYELVEKLESLNVTIVEHYMDRKKDAGDILCNVWYKNTKHQVRIDHKSTQNRTSFTLKDSMLPALAAISLAREGEDGRANAVITVSFYNDTNTYVCAFLSVGDPARFALGVKRTHIELNRKVLEKHLLSNKPVKGLLRFGGYRAYIYELEQFIEWVKYGLIDTKGTNDEKGA